MCFMFVKLSGKTITRRAINYCFVSGKVGNITLDIYDVEGKMIQRFDNLPIGQNSISLTEKLQPEIYLYTLFTDGQEVEYYYQLIASGISINN